MTETTWKKMLKYAQKYGIQARGYSPAEIFEQIVIKARNDGIDLSDEDYGKMLTICGFSNFRSKDRFCRLFDR